MYGTTFLKTLPSQKMKRSNAIKAKTKQDFFKKKEPIQTIEIGKKYTTDTRRSHYTIGESTFYAASQSTLPNDYLRVMTQSVRKVYFVENPEIKLIPNHKELRAENIYREHLETLETRYLETDFPA